MSDLGDDFRAMREAQRERRASRLPGRTVEILEMERAGFRVRQLTPYQFRVETLDGAVDLYPIHRRYHVIRTNRRGTYRNALAFVRDVLTPKGVTS